MLTKITENITNLSKLSPKDLVNSLISKGLANRKTT